MISEFLTKYEDNSQEFYFDNLDRSPTKQVYTLWMRDQEGEFYDFDGKTVEEAIVAFETWKAKPIVTEEHLDDIREEMMANTI